MKQRSKSENSESRPSSAKLSERIDRILTVGFHCGLSLIAITLICDFLYGTPMTSAMERLWLITLCLGYLIAGSTWIAGSTLTRWQKAALMIGIFVTTTYEGMQWFQAFQIDRQVLLPGRIEQGRYVHDGLGMSFAIAPNMRPIQRISVANLSSGKVEAANRSRLRFGEEATIFQLTFPHDVEGLSSPIRLQVMRFRFSRIDAVVQHVLSNQRNFSAQPGERLDRPLRFQRLGDLDILDFELMRDQQHVLTRYVYLRSGTHLVSFVLCSPNEEDRAYFDEFVRSVEIKGRATGFKS